MTLRHNCLLLCKVIKITIEIPILSLHANEFYCHNGDGSNIMTNHTNGSTFKKGSTKRVQV